MSNLSIKHSFDVSLAVEFGVNAAILYENILFWVRKNEANEKHFHDGHYWTYNSAKAFKELFPYMGEKQIRNSLKILEDEGYLITGNYNKSSYDRTKWYSISRKEITRLPKRQMEKNEKANENNQKGEPIPYINTDINTYTHISEKNTRVSADQDLNKYFEELHNGKYKPDNVDRNHNAFTFENKELNDQLDINWEALVNQFNEITNKKAKAVLPRAKRQIIHLITNGYTKSDLVKVFTLASRDDWFKNNSNALNIDYLTREEVFTKYADI